MRRMDILIRHKCGERKNIVGHHWFKGYTKVYFSHFKNIEIQFENYEELYLQANLFMRNRVSNKILMSFQKHTKGFPRYYLEYFPQICTDITILKQ